MKKLLSLVATSLLLFSAANAEVIGIVDFDKVVDNYTRVKTVSNEISDKYAEIQRYTLDKEREYKKLSTPLERKNFEEVTARELSKRQEAYLKLKERKEAEIDLAIKNAIKQVAMTSKVTTVVEKSVVFFGGVDLTDKVVKQLNNPVVK
ncbi:MAG: OmpH family outer membrane protein [Candidatus Gastranaerophilales bacterium]|nr:OmpH family outer membrane protein [Candidatus Gastranaerophilales bacterium]